MTAVPAVLLVTVTVGAAALWVAPSRPIGQHGLRPGRPVVATVVGASPPGSARRARRPGRWGSRARPPTPDLAATVVLVEGLLRAGQPPAQAWSRTLGTAVLGPAPTTGQLIGDAPADQVRGRALAVVAACRVADRLGAPLAPVLEVIGEALAADADAEADLAAALAGPRAGARVVGWLPVIGTLAGMALGADPIGVLLGGGLGTLAGTAGLALLAVGHGWTRALVVRAQRAGR
jgi:tight adherence protein B